MGSGTKNRKGSDAPYIRRPKMFTTGAGGAATDVGGRAASICIASFDQKVTQSSLTREGVKVRLVGNGDRYSIVIGSNTVGELSAKYSAMVTACNAMGVKYSGEIIEKNNKPYARFARISR